MVTPAIVAQLGYEFVRYLISGGFARIFVVRSTSGQRLACKYFPNLAALSAAWVARGLPQELNIQKQVRHPNCMAALAAGSTTTEAYIIMEAYAPNGTAHAVLYYGRKRPLPECLAWIWFRDIASGVNYLHQNRYGTIGSSRLFLLLTLIQFQNVPALYIEMSNWRTV